MQNPPGNCRETYLTQNKKTKILSFILNKLHPSVKMGETTHIIAFVSSSLCDAFNRSSQDRHRCWGNQVAAGGLGVAANFRINSFLSLEEATYSTRPNLFVTCSPVTKWLRTGSLKFLLLIQYKTPNTTTLQLPPNKPPSSRK